MFLLDDTIVYSASDLSIAADCEFGLLRRLDDKLGRLVVEDETDAMLAKAAQLGQVHEDRVLARYRAAHGDWVPGTPGGVAEIERPPHYDRAGLEQRLGETLQALHDGVAVVVQGSFFDGRFHGRSDFVVKEGDRYVVYDTKLARHAKITALLQLAAYADQLTRLGIDVGDQVGLMLGDYDPDVDPDRGLSLHPVADIMPVYLARRARLEQIIDEHHAETGPVQWRDPRYTSCGRCPICTDEATSNHDVLLVAGMRMTQRARLADSGVVTIEQLAESEGGINGISSATLAKLREQARLQVAQAARPMQPNGQPVVEAVVFDTSALEALPAPDPGDIYFDFEGNPLWSDADLGEWGLEYLFGVVEADTGDFRAFWAHDRAQEKQALTDFLAYVAERRAAHPGMHVYHYAAYERSALLRLAVRHGVGEDFVDDLLRHGVLVDLYATVRKSVRVSQPSYSIKKLEPLYMGDELRAGDVTNAADSVIQYQEACERRDAGDLTAWQDALDSIADYNRYDCVSTLRLCGWLRDRAAEHGITWSAAEPVELDGDTVPTADPLVPALLTAVGDTPRPDRTADQQAFAMVAAALDYHRREDKPFWWAHYDRLVAPVDEWGDTRDVFVVESGRVVTDWHKPPRARLEQREVELVGEWGPGSTAGVGQTTVVLDSPLPEGLEPPGGCTRFARGGDLVERRIDGGGREVVVLVEKRATDVPAYDALPFALTPQAGPPAKALQAAIHGIAERVVHAGLEPQAGLDVLRRRPPRTRSGSLPAVADGTDGPLDAITAAVADLDRSYLAVQGPPGTGKTYVGARVVMRLVEQGWRVGVVAQSHAVVETFLDKAVGAGLDPEKVGKHAKRPDGRAWTTLSSADALAGFLTDHASGCLVGGTAWDFTNLNRVGRRELDLLVVDEAGQFSLANTLAVSVAAQRLLLLGDPQQLPQVSQGTHPEPVDGSALGWLNEGHATLLADRGYFLERSWRMHPDLCARVSTLSYDDRLRSHEAVTAARALDGIAPGVRVVHVEHEGNSTSSPQEAAQVATEVSDLLGRAWTDPREGLAARPLGPRDILVVAPYNAQVAQLRATLDAAGYTDVAVGTVDKFQGQEAPVVIVSMTASSPADLPRGTDFLISRNRVNVAVSRGKWAAIVVKSPRLTDYLPHSPESLGELGAFLRLTSP